MLREKAEDLRERLKAEAQAKFIRKVAAEDGIPWEDAYNLCLGLTDPVDHHYTLGYKLADPVLQTGLWGPGTKKEKAKVQRMLEAELCPEEIRILHEDVLPIKPGKAFRAELRKKRKGRGGTDTGTDVEGPESAVEPTKPTDPGR